MDIDMTEVPMDINNDPRSRSQDKMQTINPSVQTTGQAPEAEKSSRGGSVPARALNGSSPHPDIVTESGMNHPVASPKEAVEGSQIVPEKRSTSTPDETTGSLVVTGKPSWPTTGRTGVCYDQRMRLHSNLVLEDEHPEDPRRIGEIYRAFARAALVWDPEGETPHPDDILHRIWARKATSAEIRLVHTTAHYEFVRDTRDQSIDRLRHLTTEGDSVYYNRQSFTCARLAVGGAIECCKAVLRGDMRNAIAVIRPPGHHAVPDEAQGFCIFNNVSIAAKVCQETFPDSCRKILIFDWDVHHGNGTQDTFYKDPNVLYMSIHVYLDGKFYPSFEGGDHNHCGDGPGVGKNVNVPWSEQGMANAEYMYAFQKVIMPIAWEFNPDLVIVSAGFDAAEGDDIGGCFVTPACYAQMTHALMSLAKGKVVVCLEGGYNLESTSSSALAVAQTLTGVPPGRLERTRLSPLAIEDVHKVMRRQSLYWECMSEFRPERDMIEPKAEQLHDVVQSYRAYEYARNHNMVLVQILQGDLSRPFRNEVMATSNHSFAKDLLFIVHDPPELMGIPDSKTGALNGHRSWLTDRVKDYIEWACKKGYGVVDANIPSSLEELDDPDGPKAGKDARSIELMKSLVEYLWENYIQVSDAQRIFFLGIGAAYRGIIHLLNSRSELRISSLFDVSFNSRLVRSAFVFSSGFNCSPALKGVVNIFSGVSLRSVRRDEDPELESWYYKNSRVYVNSEHDVWSRDSKALKRRFGRLKKSSENELGAMVDAHREEILSWVDQHGRS